MVLLAIHPALIRQQGLKAALPRRRIVARAPFVRGGKVQDEFDAVADAASSFGDCHPDRGESGVNVRRCDGVDGFAAKSGEDVLLEGMLPLLEAAVTTPTGLVGDQIFVSGLSKHFCCYGWHTSGARFALGLERVHALEALPLGFPS